ncbi:MAG: class I SAM-dependent methyltransferase [Tagaea sp.]|nr:class I SAM-dependent methyltransferase [Tagaea sp.]
MTPTPETPRELVWTPELVARFWDWQSRFPENYFAHQYGAGIAARAAGHFAAARSILDFGCGTGVFVARLLATTGARVSGADLSTRSLEATRRLNAAHPNFGGAHRVDALVSDGAGFDAITLLETVEHLYDDDLERAVDLVWRLAAPGARIVITTPNDEDLSRQAVYCPVSDVTFHRWQHVRSWTAPGLAAFMSARRFRPLEISPTDLIVGPRRYRAHAAWRRIVGRPPATPHLFAVFERIG